MEPQQSNVRATSRLWGRRLLTSAVARPAQCGGDICWLSILPFNIKPYIRCKLLRVRVCVCVCVRACVRACVWQCRTNEQVKLWNRLVNECLRQVTRSIMRQKRRRRAAPFRDPQWAEVSRCWRRGECSLMALVALYSKHAHKQL